ncbi:MAG: hypothetical protein NE334_11475 [Lentisphaeraceae bacterium]|nr:hypothetical protein [Lentisphaeraceae bacterium]
MKYLSVILTFLAALTAYLCTSFSQKTSGNVKEYSSFEFSLPENEKLTTTTLEELTPEELSIPQLIALDEETAEVIKKATITEPESMAEWATNIENEAAQGKVLSLVLSTWADQTPRTCAMWTESLPPHGKYLDIYKSVASAWARNTPSFAIEWALELEKKSFRIPVLKTIVEVWAENDPENAGDWLLFLNKADLRSAVFPSLIHTWFIKSPQNTFDWLVKFKGTDLAGVDSIYLMKKWIDKDNKAALSWLASEYSTPFTDSLKKMATTRLAKVKKALAVKYINDKNLAPIKSSLIHAIINESAGKDNKTALEALRKLEDQELKDDIAESAALKLAGKDKEAISYVKAAGFLTFEKLDQFFGLWVLGKGKETIEWFRNNTSKDFIPELLGRLVSDWNRNNPSMKVSNEILKESIEILSSTSNYTIVQQLNDLPLNVRDRYYRLLNNWEDRKKQLFQNTFSVWADKEYAKSFLYVQELDETTYKYFCMRALLPQTPQKHFNSALAMCKGLKSDFYKKEMTAYLAIALSSNSPEKALRLLQKNQRLEANFVYQVIDHSVKPKSRELLESLRKTVRKNLHIFMPYYFYQRAIYDPKGSFNDLSKYKKEIFYNQSLRALAAAYKDFHSQRAPKWLKSLSNDEKIIIGNLLSSTVEKP